MSSIDFIKLHIASDNCLGQEDYNPSLEFDSSLFVAIGKSLCCMGKGEGNMDKLFHIAKSECLNRVDFYS